MILTRRVDVRTRTACVFAARSS